MERLHWRQAFVDMCSIFFAMDGGFLLNDNVIILPVQNCAFLILCVGRTAFLVADDYIHLDGSS